MNTIVVGVDGTQESLAALRFAVQEAHLRHDDLKIVTTWHIPTSAYGAALAPAAPDPADFEETAGAVLADAVSFARTVAADIAVHGVLREGDAAHVLVEEARGAEQLVVGCHELGRLRALFHHSVSGECAHEARCPVTVVH